LFKAFLLATGRGGKKHGDTLRRGRAFIYELARHRHCQKRTQERGEGRARNPPKNFEQENIMHNNNVLKRLLTAAAVAACFSAFGVHAQATAPSNASGSGQDATTQTGKTTREGTAGNTNSRGKDEQVGNQANQGSKGTSGSQGSMGTSNVGDTTGTGQSSGMTGKTTREGTIGNTESQGMEKRQGKEMGAQGASGMGGSEQAGAAAATSKLNKTDEKILKNVAQANMAEIEAGKLAVSKTQNDNVKSFAQQMIDDHTKALNDVQQLAQSKGVTLPTEPDAKHKAMGAKLSALSGEAFDKAYMSGAGVSDHKKVHSMLKSDEKRAKDPDVKALVAKMTPVVEQHLKSAQQMPAVKSGTTSGK
jgi:predicted outer membrane protein